MPPSSFADRALVIAAALALVALLGTPATPLATSALAESPTPTPLIEPADPRTDSEPPGTTGAPLLAALGVIVIGVVAALGTLLYVRLMGRR